MAGESCKNWVVCRLEDKEILELLLTMVFPKVVRLDGTPIYSDRERCNLVWRKIAAKHDLDWKTISPIMGCNPKYFVARRKRVN